MDVTYEYYLNQIKSNPNKNHYRVRRFKKAIEEHISGLRLTAYKKRGTFVAQYCNAEANRYERLLKNALEVEHHP